jgi:hypothetical protein
MAARGSAIVNVTAAAPAPAKALDSHASGNHVSENSSASQSTSQATNALLAVVVFLGAFLLFSVQLLLGK